MTRPRHTDRTAHRASGLRRQLTVSEARLWSVIKNKRTGARFRRQVPLGLWIADFASFDPRLVIEVDGATHDWRDETTRTAYLESLGFAVLRFSNHDIARDVWSVAEIITIWVERLRTTGRPPGR